ncbi:MAG TPA: MerR family transcriptional regulator [Syntrophaceae bacterium]|nr:MerR family transcriptional regulator [Syntrophaceae bacterium]
MYTINEVSRRVNLSQKRIREYEKEGFIKPERQRNTNNRIYSEYDINQIKRINYLIHERGFTLAGLKELLIIASCWNIFDCRNKESCTAYRNPHENCWEVKRKAKLDYKITCTRCPIYLIRSTKSIKKERILEKLETLS